MTFCFSTFSDARVNRLYYHLDKKRKLTKDVDNASNDEYFDSTRNSS